MVGIIIHVFVNLFIEPERAFYLILGVLCFDERSTLMGAVYYYALKLE